MPRHEGLWPGGRGLALAALAVAALTCCALLDAGIPTGPGGGLAAHRPPEPPSVGWRDRGTRAPPAIAAAESPPDGACPDPETTGALPAAPRSLGLPGSGPTRGKIVPVEESWQDEFRSTPTPTDGDPPACPPC